MRLSLPGRFFVVCFCFILLYFSGYSFSYCRTDREVDEIVKANTRFGFKLFSRMFLNEPDKNIFISPFSIFMALEMTYNGADGKTMEEMAGVMEIQGMSPGDVNGASLNLLNSMEKMDPGVKLAIANSLWGRKGINFKAKFVNSAKSYYNAEVRSFDFADPKTISIINSWVEKKTSGKIDRIVEKINPLDILFLINATYFKGTWAREFDKELTKERIFTLADGKKKKIPMMCQSGKFKYLETEKFQAISLPYGKGRLSMYIFLPKDGDVKDFCSMLNYGNWQEWMFNFHRTEGDIVLPKFKMGYEANLGRVLISLGMKTAFDINNANFTKMCAPPMDPYISKVKHKTFVEVNEEGTEAAGVTAIRMTLKGMPVRPPERFNMVVDHPFFCAIRDNLTGTILFMGNIMEPK